MADQKTKGGYAIFLVVPAVLSSALTWRVVRNFGGYCKEKHALLMSTISMFAVAIAIAAVSIIDRFYTFEDWSSLEILFVMLAAVFTLQLLVFFAVGGISLYKAAIPASLQIIFSTIILYSFRAVQVKTLARFVLLIAVAFWLVWLFVKLTDMPFKRTLGINTSTLVALALREWAEPGMVNFNPFAGAGKDATVHVQALRYDFGTGNYLISVPWLHPGPIESIGGKLPSLIKSRLKGKFEQCVFLHTYVDHSLNPIFLDKVVQKIAEVSANGKASGSSAKATKFIEVKKDGVNVIAQKIGGNYLFITTFAPEITDDISYAVGSNLLNKLGKKAILVDAHNSLSSNEDEDPVGIGDEKAKNLESALEYAKEKIDREKQNTIKIGIASSENSFMHEGIKGIDAVVFSINGQKAVFVVLDANNVAPNFRERIRKKLKGFGFGIAEIATTDSHLGDFILQKYGKVGLINQEILEREIIDIVKQAENELKGAKAAYLFADFKARVFGEKLYHQIVATGSSVIPFAKFVAVSTFVAFLFSAHVLLNLW